MTAFDSNESPVDDLDIKNAVANPSSSGGNRPPGIHVADSTADDPNRTNHQPQSPEKKETVKAVDEPTVIQPKGAATADPDEFGPASDIVGIGSGVFIDIPTNIGNFPAYAGSFANPGGEFNSEVIQGSNPAQPKQGMIDQVIGPYRILGELGRGGMGVVYKARHRQLHRDVALKMILRASDTSRENLNRFELEAQSVATLKHPGIVQIYEYGKHQGVPWFSLEFIDGKTLAQISAVEPLDPGRAARIVADLAAAVSYAHERGVLHRDIKPANVLIAAGDVPKLTDFGLAKRVASEEDATDLKTIDGQIMGTPGYMPPEQARGATSLIGPHSDQYALGATLYHLLTGRPPFVGQRALEVIIQVIDRDPLTVRQLRPSTPLDLETICLRALSKEPSRRYPDCAALEADLRRYLRHEPIVARPISGLERAVRWCWRNPKIAIPVATAVVAVLTALTVSLFSASALATKNREIAAEKDQAIAARKLAVENEVLAGKNAREAEANAKLAYRRAVDAKDAVQEMLLAIRDEIPSLDVNFNSVRKKMLSIASVLLDRLPDAPDDDQLNVGLEKARILEARIKTALELGQPSKAVDYLNDSEQILRARNVAQGTDDTRTNLTTTLFRQMEARLNVQRDMDKVIQYGEESLRILDDVLIHPTSVPVDPEQNADRLVSILTNSMTYGYRLAHTLKRVGRVHQALVVIDKAISRFDESMIPLRLSRNFKHLTDEEFADMKPAFRGQLADLDQLRAILLASVGRSDEAASGQQRVLDNLRQFADHDPSPGQIESASKMSLALVYAGDLARQQGHFDEALESYEESANITRVLYSKNPALADRRNNFHVSLMRLAGLLRIHDLPQSRQLYAEAKRVAQEMVDADAEAIPGQIALALVSPFSGPPDQAVALAESILNRSRMNGPIDAEIAVDVARVFAASAESMTSSESPDSDSVANWKQRALELLKDAIKSGYQDGVYLAGEPDFTAIQSLPEFKTLLEQCAQDLKSGAN